MQSQGHMISLLIAGNYNHYKKSGVYKYIICTEETEVTTAHNGQIETKNTAYPGDYILTDTLGGEYVIKPKVFQERYELLDDNTATAKGECWAMPWVKDKETFESPWKQGEEMIIETGDYLCSPNFQFSEAYRVKKEEFEKSYKLVIPVAKPSSL